MNDEIKATLKTIQYAEEQEWKNLYTYIEQLQFNWNSLREYIKNNSIYYNTSDGCQWVDQFKLLDKMNELERGDKM